MWGITKKIWKSSNNRTWSLLYFVWAQVLRQANAYGTFQALWNTVQMVCIALCYSHSHSFFLSDSDLPFHLIVYICMLEFMFTSFDFLFRCALENAILSLLHMFNPPKWKIMCTQYISLLTIFRFLLPATEHKIFGEFLQCCRSNRIIMWKRQFKMHSMQSNNMATNHTTDSNSVCWEQISRCASVRIYYSANNSFFLLYLCGGFFRVNWITCGLMVGYVKYLMLDACAWCIIFVARTEIDIVRNIHVITEWLVCMCLLSTISHCLRCVKFIFKLLSLHFNEFFLSLLALLCHIFFYSTFLSFFICHLMIAKVPNKCSKNKAEDKLVTKCMNVS